jgi:hypothetical protein
MDETFRLILTHVITFVGGYLSRYIEPRARLVHWFPGWVTFALPVPGAAPPQTLNVSTHALTIWNSGWRPATQVEILHGTAPQLFRFIPQINFTQGMTPAGEHVISIGALAPREWVTLQVLTVGPFPPLRSVRSTEGPSRQVTTRQTLASPPLRRRVLQGLALLGLATALYWAWRIMSRVLPSVVDFLSK